MEYKLVIAILSFFLFLGNWIVLTAKGSMIVFSKSIEGNLEIVVTDEDGQHMKNLSKHPADDYDPAWSPDGKHIAFVSNRDGNREIYIMDADGSNQRRVTRSPLIDVEPSFAPDGRRLLFTRMPAIPAIGDIFLTDIDGQNETYITNGAMAEWSPDGKRIAFSKKDPELGKWGIHVMDTDGRNQVNITKHLEWNCFYPAWSPDGKQIAFASDSARTGFWDIYKMDSDGQNVERLTQVIPPEQAWEPTWSPDGQHIAYWSALPGQDRIVVMKANGSNQRVIAEGGGGPPSWFDPAFARQYMVNPSSKLAERWGMIKRDG